MEKINYKSLQRLLTLSLDGRHGPDGYIAQWLERLTADQQVPGSNPGVPSYKRAYVRAEAPRNASITAPGCRLRAQV